MEETAAAHVDGPAGSRVDRRTAMKAVVAGGVAGAVWSAPRIEGFSLLPDFAAAATCTTAAKNFSGDTNTGFGSRTSNCCYGSCSDMTCWNSGASRDCSGGCFSNNWSCSGTATTGNLNIAKNDGGNLNLAWSIKGPVGSGRQSQLPTLAVTMTGIDPPFISCLVTSNVACNSGTHSGDASVTFNANATNNSVPVCTQFQWCGGNGTGTSNAAISITMTCTCL